MQTLALDSSVLLAWLLQERGWQAVDRLLASNTLELLMPGPALTEAIYRARSRGNASSPELIAEALEAQGLAVEPAGRDDLVTAAKLHEVSKLHPLSEPGAARVSTLSLADCLILAVSQRIGCRVVTRDRYWAWLADQGHLDVEVVPF